MPLFSSFSSSVQFSNVISSISLILNLIHTIKWNGFAVGDGGLDISTDGTERVFIGHYRDFSGNGTSYEVDLLTGNEIAEWDDAVNIPGDFTGLSLGYVSDGASNALILGNPFSGGSSNDGSITIRDVLSPNSTSNDFINAPRLEDGSRVQDRNYGYHISTNKYLDSTSIPKPNFAVGADGLIDVYEASGLATTTRINRFESPMSTEGFGGRVSLVEETLIAAAVVTNEVFVYNVRDSSAPLYSVSESLGTLNYGYGLYSVPGKFFVGDGSKVYVYDIDTGNKLQQIPDPLPNSDGSTTGFGSDDRFDGFSRETANPIWANSKYLVIGAPFSNKNGTGQGRAYIYDIESYELLLELDNPHPSGVTPGGHFGCNVALNEDYLVVIARFNKGADGSNYRGNTYIYEIS